MVELQTEAYLKKQHAGAGQTRAARDAMQFRSNLSEFVMRCDKLPVRLQPIEERR
jgi:hypothetical protein